MAGPRRLRERLPRMRSAREIGCAGRERILPDHTCGMRIESFGALVSLGKKPETRRQLQKALS